MAAVVVVVVMVGLEMRQMISPRSALDERRDGCFGSIGAFYQLRRSVEMKDTVGPAYWRRNKPTTSKIERRCMMMQKFIIVVVKHELFVRSGGHTLAAAAGSCKLSRCQ
jgi:hypothetical protein